MNDASPQLRATCFGATLCELMEAREIDPTPENVLRLAEAAWLDGEALLARMSDSGEAALVDPGDTFAGVAFHLRLSDEEMMRLATSYTFEEA